MDDLIVRLVEGEIRIGLALIEAAVLNLKTGNRKALAEARMRAESAYLRDRTHVQEPPDGSVANRRAKA